MRLAPADVKLEFKAELPFDPTDWFFDQQILDEDFAWDMLENLYEQTYWVAEAAEVLHNASMASISPLIQQRVGEVQAAWFNSYYTISGWMDIMAEFNQEMLAEAPDVVDDIADVMDLCWEIEIV